MRRNVGLIGVLSLFCIMSWLSRPAIAAGAVEMQVEHIIVQTIDEYNQSMEAGDHKGWMRYFTENVRRQGPLSSQQGKKEFAEYFEWEFKNFQGKYVVKKMLISGRSAALQFLWDAIHKPSGTLVQIEMVALYEMASSGRFDSVSFYFDTAKFGKLLAQGGVAPK